MLRVAVFAGCLLCVGAVAQAREGAAATHSWLPYHNQRYGFSLSYPTDVFQPERASEAGDGLVLVSKEGDARLLVGTLDNGDRLAPKAFRDRVAKDSYSGFDIKRRQASANGFALAGDGNGKAFYEKAIFSCEGRLITSFVMIYPSGRRGDFEGMIERIGKSFRPALTPECRQSASRHVRQARHAPRRHVRQARRYSPPQRYARSGGGYMGR